MIHPTLSGHWTFSLIRCRLVEQMGREFRVIPPLFRRHFRFLPSADEQERTLSEILTVNLAPVSDAGLLVKRA
jgi:hypothetical protein